MVNSLFPPKLHVLTRSISISSSRSLASSTTPHTPHGQDISPCSSLAFEKPRLVEMLPFFVDYLDARDMLRVSATTRHFGSLRTSPALQRHLTTAGWDTKALLRRTETSQDSTGRPWMFLARSALYKGDIATRYVSLPKEGEKGSSNSKDKRAAERFFRALVDLATEHDQKNFKTLNSLAAAQGMSLIRFVSDVRAHDWKTRYRKTFVIAAFIDSQPPQPVIPGDLEALADNLTLHSPKAQLSFLAARANLIYSYCSANRGARSLKPVPHKPVPSTVYDPPHVRTLHGTALPGVQHALNRFTRRNIVSGFYQKAKGAVTSVSMTFEPRGLASRTRVPFTEKRLLTLTAEVVDGDGNGPWFIEGSFDRKTGIGKLKNPSGDLCYEMWITPWGVMGEKMRNEGAHLGYFVLYWA